LTALRAGLPPLPPRLTGLPIDARGYPVPWFVEVVDGVPDHRIMDGRKLPIAVREHKCWICGQPMGSFSTFVIGPMCSITRCIAEPPSHRECARYAATACPFLSRPHATRRVAGMPEGAMPGAGMPLLRNPGAVGLWTTKIFHAYRVGKERDRMGEGTLFKFGDPTSIEWYSQGRPATKDEVLESIRSGLPALADMAQEEGPTGLSDLALHIGVALKLLAESFPVDQAGELKIYSGDAHS
jgi:hypothetical protein